MHSQIVIISILCPASLRTASGESLVKVESLDKWMGAGHRRVGPVWSVSFGNRLPCIPRTASRCPAWSLWRACCLLWVGNCFHHPVFSHMCRAQRPAGHTLSVISREPGQLCACLFLPWGEFMCPLCALSETTVVSRTSTLSAPWRNSPGEDS